MSATITNLSELWQIAQQYGRVRLFTNDDGTYHACIVFSTIEHTVLEAKSDFKQMTPEDAITMAIKSAESIVENVSKITIAGLVGKLLK